MSKQIINLVLLLFASVAVALLIRYTNIVDTGFNQYIDDGIAGVKKIWQEKPLDPTLDQAEKEKLRQALEKQNEPATFFCGSVFFPIVPGANWRYQVANGEKPDIVNVGIPAPKNNVFFLDSRLASEGKWTLRTLATCREGKIRLTDWNFWEAPARSHTVTTPCQENTFYFSLPRDSDFAVGNVWTEKGCLKHEILDDIYNETVEEITEEVEARWKYVGQEKVQVPAGSFDAEKMEMSFTRNQKTDEEAKNIEAAFKLWIAPGVGAVKIVYQEYNVNGKPSGKKPVVEELIGYQIPRQQQ